MSTVAQTLTSIMTRLPRPRFLLILAIPLFAKLLAALGFALRFVFEVEYLNFFGLLAFAALTITALVFVVRFLIRRHWIEGVLLFGFLCLSIFTPMDFHPEYWKFRLNKEAYVAAVRADPSPSPKFQSFVLEEFLYFPGGRTQYLIIYDESKEIGLPPQSRSHRWWSERDKRYNGPDDWNTEATLLEDDFFLYVKSD